MNKIIFFDLETTGVEITKDRIVEIGCVKMYSDFTLVEEPKKYRFNPGVNIPEEATAVHGITNEMVANEPPFAARASALYSYLKDCVLGGYNIISFDVPLLSEEFARCGITWPEPGQKIVDAFNIFREKEKRDLTSAYKFYCGKQLEGAHDALNDVTATAEVFRAMVTKYEDLTEMSLEQIHDFCQGQYPFVDVAGKIVLKEGVPVYSFGKDKFKSVVDNPGFGRWMLNQDFPTNTKNVIISLIGG